MSDNLVSRNIDAPGVLMPRFHAGDNPDLSDAELETLDECCDETDDDEDDGAIGPDGERRYGPEPQMGLPAPKPRKIEPRVPITMPAAASKDPRGVPQKREAAAMSKEIGFAMDAEGSDDGDHVVYDEALIFRIGDYPDKKFSMTEDEAIDAVESFEPCPNELAHINSQFQEKTILDGKLGEVRDIWLSEDGTEVRGQVAIPKWLDSVWEGTKRVSAVWDRSTKMLKGLGLVVKGRVEDAALMAAFAESHPEDCEAMFSEADDGTRHGREMIQLLHDQAHEQEGSELIHQMACDHGARCSEVRQATKAPAEALMSRKVAQFKALFGANLEADDDEIEEFLDCFAFGNAAEKAGDAADDEEPDDDEDDTPPPPKRGRRKPPPFVKKAAMSETRRKPAEDPRLATMADEIATLRRDNLLVRIEKDAATFAEHEVKQKRSLEAERGDLIEEYIQAAMDDSQIPTRVSFSDSKGKPAKGSRVQALLARKAKRPPHGLFREYVGMADLPEGSRVLHNQTEASLRTDPEKVKPSEERINQLLEMQGMLDAVKFADSQRNGK